MAQEHPAELIPQTVLELFADVLQMPLMRSTTALRGDREVKLNLGSLKFPFELKLVGFEVWPQGKFVDGERSDVGLFLRGPGDFALVVLYEQKREILWALVGDAMEWPTPDNAKALTALKATGVRKVVSSLMSQSRGIFRLWQSDAEWEPIHIEGSGALK